MQINRRSDKKKKIEGNACWKNNDYREKKYMNRENEEEGRNEKSEMEGEENWKEELKRKMHQTGRQKI